MNELFDILVKNNIPEACALKMRAFAKLVADANESFNLTRITSYGEMAVKHFLDSLAPVKTGMIPKHAKVIDIGTGAGFPGVPIKILRPDIDLTLVDSSLKKITFLKSTLQTLEIDANALSTRAEELAKERAFRETFDIALSRATAPLKILLEISLPFVKMGGKLICYLSKNQLDELKHTNYEIHFGAKLAKTQSAGIEGLDHFIAAYQKNKKTDAQFPRKYAQIKKNPL